MTPATPPHPERLTLYVLPDETAGEDASARLFFLREQVVAARWLEALQHVRSRSMFVLQAGPQYFGSDALEAPPGHARLAAQARELLGEAMVFTPRTEFEPQGGDPDADLAAYFVALGAAMREHLATHGLTYDAASATSELWGESFEGCVPGYGGMSADSILLPHG